MSQNRLSVVGPVLDDLHALGFGGRDVFIASAFYSAAPLSSLSISARQIHLMVRLDLRSIEDWVAGRIAPYALLNFVKRYTARGTNVRLMAGKSAHAKVYIGQQGFLIGSANLTSRGLAGIGHEVLWKETSSSAVKSMREGLEEYATHLKLVDLEELEEYIRKNAATVARRAKKERCPEIDESRVPPSAGDRPTRLGNYADFKDWLDDQPEPAAKEILARAEGKGNLSGHIYRAFYGLRQFLIARPAELRAFRAKDPDSYKLSADKDIERELRQFVLDEANDEHDFLLDRWKTYLPVECGGRAGKHGGTIGNLNRMLPLVARYLVRRRS